MTALQTLLVREGEVKKRNAEITLLEGDALTEEVRAEGTALTTEYCDLQTRITAARIADPSTEVTDDAEGRELRQMTDDANLDAIFMAAIEHRSTTGRERELQEHFKLGPNQVPLSMLGTEHRDSGGYGCTYERRDFASCDHSRSFPAERGRVVGDTSADRRSW